MHGLSRPADLVTKHMNQHLARKHLEILDMRTEGGRAANAPTLSSVARAPPEDDWSTDPDWPAVVRAHRKPRKEFFTPTKIQGAPAAASIAQVRVTRGKFMDNGEEFCVVENLTRRDGKAHEDLGRRWTGTTAFFLKTR